MMIDINEDDFDTLCICSIRYCMGRQTYLPTAVRKICNAYMSSFTDRTLRVMLKDCEEQESINNYGDEKIDKPGWVRWRDALIAEQQRRENDTGRN